MSDDLADGALIDVCDLTLSDLSALGDESDESDRACMTRALARILAGAEEEGHHGFQSCI